MGEGATTSPGDVGLLRLVTAIALLVAPAAALSVTPLRAAAVIVFAGMIPALLALMHGRRIVLVTTVVTAVLVAFVELANPFPAAAAILMVAVGLGVGASGLWGWQSLAAVACTWPATLLVGSPVRLADAGWFSGFAASVVIPALITLLGGLWVLVVGLVLPALPHPELTPLAGSVAGVYGAALAVLLGSSAFVASTWWHGSNAGWILLTILVIVRPGYTETRRRAVTRSLGTIGGGLAAAVLALAVPLRAVLVVVGLVALITAIVLQLKRANYAVYAFALTAAIVLLSSREGDVFTTDVQRVAFTVIGALLAATLLMILEITLKHTHSAAPRSG